MVLNGQPAFTAEPSQQAQQALQQSLPPPDGSVAEDEAVEADAEEVAEEVVEEAVAEAEEAVEESAEEEAVEEVVEEVAEEVEEAELDEAADAEEEAEETSDEEDLDSLGVDESSVESQSDAENAEDVASNEGEGEAVESSDDEALSTFTNPDTSVESATEDVDTTLETLQSQDSNVEGQDSGELQTLGAASTNIEESVAEVEDVVAEEPQEVIAPDNPPEALADEITVLAGGAIDVTDQLLGNDSDPDAGQVLAIISVDSARPDAVTLVDGRVQFQPDESLLQSLSAGETTTETLSYTVESGTSKADADVVIVYQGSNDAPVANNDVAETNEDVPLVLAVISNDSDPDLADTLVITSVDGSTALGVITITDDGQSLLYEPSQSLSEGSVDDVFSYTISDGNTTATATVTVTVAGVNDPPVLVSDPTGFTLELVPEAGEISIPLDAIFADSDLGSTLTVLALDTELTRGAVRIGSVLYDPGDAFDYLKEGEIGIEQFGITVQDEFGQTGQGVFSFQIEGINDAPIAVANTNEVPENGAIDLAAASSVLGDDADVDGDALTVSSIRTGNVAATNGAQGEIGSTLVGAYGVLTLNADGQYSYATTASAVDGLAAGATAVDVFTYTITDGALSASAELLITVTGVNDAPVAVADTLDAIEDTPETYTAAQLVGNDTDVENSELSLSSVTSGSNGTAVLNADGTVTFTPNADYAGAADFTYIVNDGTADSTSAATVTVNVGAVNDTPVAVADTLDATEDTPETYTAAQLVGNDTDVENSELSLSSVTSGSNGTAVLNADGTVTFTPNADYAGAADFTYIVNDGTADSTSAATVTVNVGAGAVNNTPVAVADTLDATEDTPETYTAAQLVGNDTDVENSELSLSSVTSGSNGTAVLNADGTVTFTPNADYAGAADFTYIVNDGTADSTSAATVTVNVGAVNDTPVAVADTLDATEDTPETYTAAQLVGNDTDVENSELSLSSVTSGSNGTAVLNADGTVTFTPNADYAGAADFTYIVNDGTADSTSAATVTVNVGAGAVNNTPVAVADTLDATEDTPETYTAAQLVGNDTDVENSELSLSSVTSGSNGTAVLNADGTVTFTPNADYAGAADFTYIVNDGTADSTSAATVTVNVGAVNDTPVAVADTLDATEDTPETYTAAQLVGNDTDVENSELSLSSVTSGSNGTAVLNADGTVTFTPNADYAGAADFTYIVNDGTADSTSAATVTVNVGAGAVNNTPVAVADTLDATEDTPETYTAAQLVGNDTDVENSELSLSSVTSGSNGTAVLNADGTVTFTPNADYAGAADFTYIVNDGTADSTSAATVTVNVGAVNDTPVAVADTLDATEDTPETYTAAQLVGNDTDVENSELSLSSVTSGSNGTAVLNADGTVTFTPNADYAGAADFTYIVNDGTADSTSAATVTVNVGAGAVNNTPVAVADTLDATEDTPETYTAAQLVGNDTDVENSELSLSSVTSGSNGTAVLNADGTVTFTPNADYAGAADFTYIVNDGTADSTSAATVTVNVGAVNDTPVAVADTLDATEDTPETYTAAQLVGNDTDVENSELSLSSVTSGSNGTAVLNADGTVTFTPNADYAGAADFTYIVNDGTADATSAATVTVNVGAVNDAPVAVANTNEVPENGAIDLAAASSVLGDDADVDGDALTVSSIRTGNVAATNGAQGEIGSTLVGAYGVLTLNADGQYSYATTASAVDGLAAGATAVTCSRTRSRMGLERERGTADHGDGRERCRRDCR